MTDHSYTPADLMLATEYFWKVDEVGDAGTYPGDVWSFTTEEYAVVEDFESYNDDEQSDLRDLDRRPDRPGQRLAGRVR